MSADTEAPQKPAQVLPPSKRRLRVKVFSPYKKFYEGEAKSVSGINAHGPFGILPGHINFFSLLVPGVVTVDTGEAKEEVLISHGIVHVRDDMVTVFAFGVIEEETEEPAEA